MGCSTDKTLKEIFRDYNSQSFALNNAKIENMNLYKKTNTLEIILISDVHIPIKEIYGLEKFLEVRFAIKNISVKVNQKENQEEKEENICEQAGAGIIENQILKEWKDIVEYVSHKRSLW